MSLELRAPNQGARAPGYGRIAECPGWVCAAEGSLAGDIRSDPNQTLAEILAAVQPRDRTRCLLESIEDVLSIADLSVAHPVLEFPQCLGMALVSRALVGCVLREPGRPVDLDRYALREGSRFEQVKRDVRAGVGE